MYTSFVNKRVGICQDKLYEAQRLYARNHPYMGRVSMISVAILDVIWEVGKKILTVIENIAVAALNLIGCLFSQKFSFKEFMMLIEMGIGGVLTLPVAICLMPPKLIYQIFAGIYDPKNIKSITYFDYSKGESVRYLFPQKV